MKQARRPPASHGPAAAVAPRIDSSFATWVGLIFVVALLLRVVHLWQVGRSPFGDVLLGDSRGYDEWALRLAQGDWIGREVFYQAPLYPYFLGVIYAVAGHSLTAVRVVQAIVGAGSCALVALAARRFFSPQAGLAAGIGLAMYAPAIFFDGLLQKSVLDLFFVSLALWIVSRLVDAPGRLRDWFFLGLALGGLSLTRENALVFIVVVFGWLLWRTRSDVVGPALVPAAAAMTLGLALVLVPVAARNAVVGGGFYLTTSQFGPNFFIGNNARADGTYMSLRFGRGAPEYERQDATELAEHASGRTLTPAEVSSYWTSRALDFITGHPADWLRLMGRKFLLLWNASEMIDTEAQESYAEFSWPLAALGWLGHFGVLVPLALAGAMFGWHDRRRLAVLYAMTSAYALSVLLFYVFARYRLPLVALLMVFAGGAVAEIVRRLGTGSWSPASAGPVSSEARTLSRWNRVVAVVTIVLAVVFTNWPVLSPSLMRAITENNLATALHAAGRSAEALTHFERAITIDPTYSPAFNNMGVVQRATGQLDSAITSYRRALESKTDYPDAHYNLANALLEKQQPAEAAQHFEIALQSIPDSAGIRNNLGIALSAQGKGADAVAAFRAAVAAAPSSASAHRNLGSALADNGQTAEAIAMLTRATTLDPNDAAAHYDLGVVLLQNGSADAAAAAFRAALRLAPGSPETHNNLGIALGSTGQMDAAIAEFERALAINRNYAEARRNLEMAQAAQRTTAPR